MLTTNYGKLDQSGHFTQIFYTHYDSCCVSLLLRYCVSQNRAQNNPKYHPRTNIRNKSSNFLRQSSHGYLCFLGRATGRVKHGRVPNGAPERALAARPRRAWVWRSPAPWDASQDCCGNLCEGTEGTTERTLPGTRKNSILNWTIYR